MPVSQVSTPLLKRETAASANKAKKWGRGPSSGSKMYWYEGEMKSQQYGFILTQFPWTMAGARNRLWEMCPQGIPGLCLLLYTSFRIICPTLGKPPALDLVLNTKYSTVCRVVWVPQHVSLPYEVHVLLTVCLGCVFPKRKLLSSVSCKWTKYQGLPHHILFNSTCPVCWKWTQNIILLESCLSSVKFSP